MHDSAVRVVTPQRLRMTLALFAVLVVAMLAATWIVVFKVDLTPQVESDFFFSTTDPAFQATKKIEELFPAQGQLLFSASTEDIGDPTYIERIRTLTEELSTVTGIDNVQSLTQGPSSPPVVAQSPIWSRLLLSKDPNTTHLIAFLQEPPDDLIVRVEEIVASHDRPSFDLRVSGVPYVVEMIRRHLMRDLQVFSVAAFLVFGVVIALLYRSTPLVVGTLLSCLGACLLTLALLHLIGTPIGILTANIATIVFVLTLSHTVFLTANWQRVRPGLDADTAMVEGVRITFVASFWCMVAALMGFGSLLLASAKPLRELGTSGLAGTVVAISVAYGFYPLFLRMAHSNTRGPDHQVQKKPAALPGPLGSITIAVVVVIAGLGLAKTDTDPSLLTYFKAGSDLRTGLEQIDQSGGSSPLYLVVRDPASVRLDDNGLQDRLAAIQTGFDQDNAVGVALSLPVLLAEARQVPLAALLSTEQLVSLLASDQYDNIARSVISEDRNRALFFLRMHETGRNEPRQNVVERLVKIVEDSGFEAELVGGLYDLQGKLGELVRHSLARELGGLLLFFVFVAAAVGRSLRVTLAMVMCLAAIPVLLLGITGHIGRPVDVISAPGANVAIALGIDAMIHLMMAVRRLRLAGGTPLESWQMAVAQMRQPIVGAMVILATGFGIFVLSSFPPTQRFGTMVAAGTLISAVMALLVLPFLARSPQDSPETSASSTGSPG